MFELIEGLAVSCSRSSTGRGHPNSAFSDSLSPTATSGVYFKGENDSIAIK
jgi:hypothetical protein